MQRAQAGGAAMAGGEVFQAQVTAFFCARILLQTPIGAMYDLPVDSIVIRVLSETEDSVDDLRIEASCGARIFGQCKRSLTLSSSVTGQWASVLKQFYAECLRVSQKSKTDRYSSLTHYLNNQ